MRWALSGSVARSIGLASMAALTLSVGCAAQVDDADAQVNDADDELKHGAPLQVLECTGKMTDDNGDPAGTSTLEVTIADPRGESLQRLSREQAAAGLRVRSPTLSTVSLFGAETVDGDLAISGSTASNHFTVWIPVGALGKQADVVNEVVGAWSSGVGTEHGDYTCKSTLPTK